jgi:SRSO17 transposase
VQGLLLDGERKSMEPLAERTGTDAQAIQQFVSQSPWDVALVQERLARKLAKKFQSPTAWIIDETSFPKAGSESVGVARQYCGALGKAANCQVAVSLHFSTDKLSCPIAWRLYLPKEWTDDPERCEKVKIPEEARVYRSKNDLALELIDEAQGWELPSAPVLADSAYGNDFVFRVALRMHDLSYVVGVNPSTKVWTSDPALVPVPESSTPGHRWEYPPLDALPETRTLLDAAKELSASAWKNVTWREGTKGAMRSRFAMLPVWAAHGIRASRHFERVREWLLIEWPKKEEAPTKYWLGYFGENVEPKLKELVKLAHGRWRIELDYRELKDELGLDHFEGRHWLGFHHHVTLVSIAFAFLRFEQLRSKKSRHTDSANGPPGSSSRPDPAMRPLPLVPNRIPRLLVKT